MKTFVCFDSRWYALAVTAHEKKQQQDIIRHLEGSAQRDRLIAQEMRQHKHFDWSLFVFHLALEKLLKALVVQAEITPPFTHNLVRLAETAHLELSSEHRDWLRTITEFNIEARYPEDKLELYQRATADYTATWHNHCEELYLWLTQKLEQNKKQ